MAESIENIVNMLNQVVFHDIPVKGFYVGIEDELMVRIDYYLYLESKKDYDEYSLVFSEIESIGLQEVLLTKIDDLEIKSFDYHVIAERIHCKILFLTGFSNASVEMVIDCRNIEIIKMNCI